MTRDRFDELAERVQLDCESYAFRASLDGRRRVIADALRAAHARGMEEGYATQPAPPRVSFVVDPEHPTRMTAQPEGARITCLMCTDTDASAVRIETDDHKHIADITVRTGDQVGRDDLTTETIAIASAIYWSWWRAKRLRELTATLQRSPGAGSEDTDPSSRETLGTDQGTSKGHE